MMPPKKLQFLHLEDLEDDRFLVARTLRQNGVDCEISSATTCEEFLTELNRQSFDLILADQSLPGFDGVSALEIVKQKTPDVPFIFVTGSMGEENAIKLIKLGATDYVLKDRLMRLAPAVQRALEECRQEKENIRAEKQIKRQARLLDEAKDAIIGTDLQNHIVFWNKGAETVYGWASTEVLGKHVRELLPGDDSPKLAEAQRQTLEKGDWVGELFASSKTGKPVVTYSHWTLVRDETGKPESILSINTDVTERKQLESQYLRAQRMESIGILAGGIAHDLNNVLAPILMVSQLLRMNNLGPESTSLLDTLESSAKHGADLIKQILSFARGVEGQHVQIQAGHLIRDLEKLLKDTLPRSIQVNTRLQRDLWMIKGVPTQVSQVLMNLCVNARDAMPNGGKIVIAAENTTVDESYVPLHPDARFGNYVAITVTDTGTGISPELLKHIYEPFFTTKETGKGTGLGLSTVKSIVKNHEGFVHVYTESGKGTSFKAYFPAVISVTPEQIKEQQAGLPRGNGECILVVDDESGVLQTTKLILQRYGYEVVTAADGADGIASFVKHRDRIQIVITDIMMPVMDGVAMIQTLLKLEPNVKIIAMSGLIESHKVSELSKWPQIEVLQKPYSSEGLLTTIQSLLAQNRRW